MEKVRMNIQVSNDELKEYRNEVYNKILNSPYYKDILDQGFTNIEIYNNVSKFKDYIDDLEASKDIKTYADCVRFNKFERIILVKNGNVIERDYINLQPYENYLNYTNSFLFKDFDDSYNEADYKKIKKDLPKKIYMALKNDRWIFLNGAFRSGRTYSAIALLNYKYMKEGASVCFINAPKRIKELSDFYFKNRNEFQELMKIYSNVDCLVIDEFGDEYKNEIVRNNIMLTLFKNRIANGKMTIFTSDYDLNEIEQLYTFKNEDNKIMAKQFIKVLKGKVGEEITVSNLSLY